MKSKVYFIGAAETKLEPRISALEKVLKTADPFSRYQKGEIIPVKLTIGDAPCIYNVNPELVRTVVSGIRAGGAKPFLFDTSVIYRGERQNAVDHLALAKNKGFSYARVGAPFIVADGVFGQDGKEYEIGSADLPKIKIPSFVGMLDNLVVLSHVTGHIVSRYAGAIKNVAMGMACRPTKLAQHHTITPSVRAEACTACGRCIAICPVKAISFVKGKAHIDKETCIGCGECLCACKFNAISIDWTIEPAVFCRRMVDVASFILSKFKKAFFVTFAFDITEECDCISTEDDKMVAGNIGILASSDPVAVDKAAVDLVLEKERDSFFSRDAKLYDSMLKYARDKGLGNTDYDLVKGC